jgi:hypothetical protein
MCGICFEQGISEFHTYPEVEIYLLTVQRVLEDCKNLDRHMNLWFANLETKSEPNRNDLTAERNKQNFYTSRLMGY